MAMTSNRPYLIRAIYDWILDNGCTPHVQVNALAPGVEVPQRYVADGRVVLNIAPRAVQNFCIGNDELVFDARFGGVPVNIRIPAGAIMAIYAQENGQGMTFSPEAASAVDQDPGTTPPTGSAGPGSGKASRLRVVK